MLRPTRIFVISDLHLGGDMPPMMSFPEVLASFITSLPGRTKPDEAIQLVIAGDVIDFLAIALDGAAEPWTEDPARAVRKLEKALHGHDSVIYAALARHLAEGHGLAILLGNHDIELALPAVQAALCARLDCWPGAIDFVDDGRAWRFGRAVVEHGNRYDDANLNDWSSLREIAASQSRGETPLSRLEPSFGSRLVCDVVNKHKQTFDFIDTLQPQGVMVAYLMAALDPSLLRSLPDLIQVWRGQSRQARNKIGAPPERRTTRSSEPAGPAPADAVYGPPVDTARLDALFGLTASPHQAGPSRTTRGGQAPMVLRELLRPGDQSLIRYLDDGTPIPRWRLELVQTALSEMMWSDNSLELNGPTGPYGLAAERIRGATGAQVVVMGHTHQARALGPAGHAQYINTGTWADLVRIPNEVLTLGPPGLNALEQWLKDLRGGHKVREVRPTWAEIRVERDGEVSTAQLMRERIGSNGVNG